MEQRFNPSGSSSPTRMMLKKRWVKHFVSSIYIHPLDHAMLQETGGQPIVCKHTTTVQPGSQLFNDSFPP